MNRKPLELIHGLGAWSSAAIVAGTMIGTGIFLVPGEMARNAGSVGLVFVVWIVGGLLSLFGAFGYAELGAAIPEAGGDYVYLKRGFGPLMGFLFGWMHTMVGRPASVATIAAGVLRFWSYLFPAVAAPLFVWQIPLPFREQPIEFAFTAAQPLAVAAIFAVTFVNYLGVRLGGRVQVALTSIKIAALLAVVVPGFLLARPESGRFEPLWHWQPGTVTGFLAALVAALWAYDGWANIALVGSEVDNPKRNIPRALVWGVSFVVGAYLIVTLVYFYVLPFASVAQSPHVGSDVVERFAGVGASRWITLAMLLSALGTLNSSILSGARVPYAMSRDGLFLRVAGNVHPRFRTPSGALFFQCILASLLALTGTFEELFSLFIFSTWIFYGLTVASLFGLNRREPNLHRPYRAWGYPWTAILFVSSALVVTASVWLEHPLRSSAGLILILMGIPVYRFLQASTGAKN